MPIYVLPLTPTPNGLDYSGLSTLHTRIAWAYIEIANKEDMSVSNLEIGQSQSFHN